MNSLRQLQLLRNIASAVRDSQQKEPEPTNESLDKKDENILEVAAVQSESNTISGNRRKKSLDLTENFNSCSTKLSQEDACGDKEICKYSFNLLNKLPAMTNQAPNSAITNIGVMRSAIGSGTEMRAQKFSQNTGSKGD